MENQQLPFHLQLRYERELRGWSQADVAEKIGGDVKTVGRWEMGLSIPRPYFRQKICEIFDKDVRSMGLLEHRTNTPVASLEKVNNAVSANDGGISPTQVEDSSHEAFTQIQHQEDWGEAPRGVHLHGRTDERKQLVTWLQQCRVVTIVGIGGVGKTTLAAFVVEQVKDTFDTVLWRSLHNMPPVEQFLKSAVQFLSYQHHTVLPDDIDYLLPLLVETLQYSRCLLVIDNFESVLEVGRHTGHYKQGYEGYGKLLQRVGEAQHNSCVLVTSREKPKEIGFVEGKQALVRTLTLAGMKLKEGQELLQDKELIGSTQAWNNLIQMYSGNPLSLKLVAQSIQDVFMGHIENFLATEESVFGDVTDLLAQQLLRLSTQEHDVLTWLAIEREAVTLEMLREDLLEPVVGLVEILSSLRRRSLLETRGPTLFTLQPVIMEYLTTQLVERAHDEFYLKTGNVWRTYAFIKALSKDYVRANQKRLILAPIAQRILLTMSQEVFEQQIRSMLDVQRKNYVSQRSYIAGNLLNLLVHLDYKVSDFDFSHVHIQQAYLQHALLTGVKFTSACFSASVFTNTFGNVLSVVFSPDGTLLAVGTATGEILMYDVASSTPLFSCNGHADGVWAVAFSPDMQLLASSSDDQTVRLWSVETGDEVRVLTGHKNRVRSISFHPDGSMLASGSDDTTILLWEVSTGRQLSILQGHTDRVWSVVFSHSGHILASASTDTTIRLWKTSSRQTIATLSGHTDSIRSLAFSSNDLLLVSGSDDKTVRLWNVQSHTILKVFYGHTNRVWSVVFSKGNLSVASGSEDQTIRLWDIPTGEQAQVLQGHTHGVRSVAYSANAPLLVSGGDDQTVRLWDTVTWQCLQMLQGYTSRILAVLFAEEGRTLISIGEDHVIRLWDRESGEHKLGVREQRHSVLSIAVSSDGKLLASGGEDQTVRLWNAITGQLLRTLRGHLNWIRAVAFSPDGSLLASGSEDWTIRLWDTRTGHLLHTLCGHKSWVRSIAFSPDSRLLASCGDDRTIRLWQPEREEALLMTIEGHTARIRSVAFHPDGQRLVSGSEDQTVRVWESNTGRCLHTLQGHTDRVRSVAYSPDGSMIASGSEDQTIRLWDSASGQHVKTLQGHTNRVRWVAFDPQSEYIASSSDDGSIKLWHIQTAQCVRTLLNERPYERMDITGVQGLTETQRAALRLLGAVEEE